MPRSPTRVLITGAAGFIGSHLVASCLDAGDEVHVAVRPATRIGRLHPFLDRIGMHRIDLGDRGAVDRCIAAARPEQIFHLAAGTRRGVEPDVADAFASVGEDLAGFLTLLAAAAAAQPAPHVLVRTGSLAEYGTGPAPFVESQREAAVTSYAAALLAGTQYAEMLAPRLPFPVVTARLGLTYGPGQSPEFLVARLIERCLAGQPTTILRPADRRDLIHVDDVVAGLRRVAATADAPGIVNLASGIAPSMREAAALVIDATGADPALVSFADTVVAGGTPVFWAATALARERFGWSAAIPLAEGIRRTVDAARALPEPVAC